MSKIGAILAKLFQTNISFLEMSTVKGSKCMSYKMNILNRLKMNTINWLMNTINRLKMNTLNWLMNTINRLKMFYSYLARHVKLSGKFCFQECSKCLRMQV